MVLRLSLSDLRHEWILSFCLVMAVAAVLSPLLILFGLKFGTIEVLRYRLVQDPRNREIRPMVSTSFDQAWFDEMRKRVEVAFIVPTTRQISATVDARLKDVKEGAEEGGLSLDLVPTDLGDRLVLENSSPIPGENGAVLSNTAADALGAEPGDTLILTAKRLKGTEYETAEVPLTVDGVLDPRATALNQVFVRLPVLEAVERYKDGQAVPEYGWPGSTPRAYPVYDGLLVVLDAPLDPVREFQLVNNSGFADIRKIDAAEASDVIGCELDTDKTLYFLSTRTKPVDEDSVAAVGYRLRGQHPVLLPWVEPFPAALLDESGRVVAEFRAVGLTVDQGDGDGLFPTAEDWNASLANGADSPAPDAPASDWAVVLLPQGVDAPQGKALLKLERGQDSLAFPVTVLPGHAPGDMALVPARLAGVANLFGERNLSWDDTLAEFVLGRRGYAGFRLYAATIDDVARIKEDLEGAGIPVHTEAARIRDVLELDRYLTLIFLLIAVVALVGGAASLMSSLYASVERKRRDLSVLRLLGLSGGRLWLFPIYQGVCIAALGFGVAWGFFELMAKVINTLFAAHLQAAESLCVLTWQHLVLALAGTVGIAVLVGLVAAWRVTSIDPAEALRDE